MKNNEKRKKRVAIYIRVSTEDQVEKYGPKIQREAIMNFIESRKHTDTPFEFAGENYVYFDNISGTTKLEDRPKFAKLIEDIELSSSENRPFDIVVVYRIDRFARKLKILHEVIDFFEENEIQFASVSENIDTSTPFGRAILSIIGVIAELEIETIKQRTQGGRESAANDGVFMGRSTPYGYKKKDKKLAILENEAEGVRTIYDLYINQKYGIGKIAKYLREHKFLSPESSAKKNKKKGSFIKKQNSIYHWNDQSIRRILTNEIYTGVYYYGKQKKGKKLPKSKWKKSDYLMPIIIDIVNFKKAQDILKESKARNTSSLKRSEPYYLGGLLTCDNCFHLKENNGSRNNWNGTGKKNPKTGKHSYFYVCSRKHCSKYDVRCTALPLPAKELEKFIIKKCLELISSPLAVYNHQQKLNSSKIEIKILNKQLEKINKLISGIPVRRKHISTQHEHGLISDTELKKRAKEINESELTYQKELKDIQVKIAQNNISEGYLRTLDLFNKKYQKVLKNVSKNKKLVDEIVHMLIDEIVVYSRNRKDTDVIAGPKKEDQKIPFRLSIRLKLPQDILNEISKQEHLIEPTFYGATEKASELTDASSSAINTSRGR